MKTLSVGSTQVDEIAINVTANVFTVRYRICDAGGATIYPKSLNINFSDLSSADLTTLQTLITKVQTKIQNVEGL